MALRPDTTLGNFFNRQHRDDGDVSGRRGHLGIAERAWRSAPVQGGHRRAAQRVRRDQRQPPGADRARRRHAGAPSRLRAAVDRVDRQHGPGALRSGSLSAEHPVVPRVRRPSRSRRRGGSLQRHAAGRHRRAVERVGQRGAARRIRVVLRAHAVGGGDVRHVRERARHAIRVRRRHAARSGGAVRASHGARPRDAAQPDVGPRLRPPAEFDVVAAFRRHQSRGPPRADSRSGSDRVERGAEAVEHRPIELSRGGSRHPFHARPRVRPQRLVRPFGGSRRSQCLHELLRHGAVAGRRRQRLRSVGRRCPASSVRARPRDADSALAAAGHRRLALAVCRIPQ